MLLVGIGGLPGVGKSTITNRISSWAKTNQIDHVEFSPDAMVERLAKNEIDCSPEMAWNICIKETEKACKQNKPLVVFDAPHISPEHKSRPVAVADRFGYNNVLIMLYSNIKRCKQQQKNRGRVIPEKSWQFYVEHFKQARNLGWQEPWKKVYFVENLQFENSQKEVLQIIQNGLQNQRF